jgi:hypothetical protein
MQIIKLYKCETKILLGVLLSQPQKELCNLGFNPINKPINYARKGKAHNQDCNINTEAKDEVEMQTPIDDSGIFTKVSRSMQASP